jgi:hypothetical protein
MPRIEGFIIVTAINLGSPGRLIAPIAALGVLIGRWAIGLARRVEIASARGNRQVVTAQHNSKPATQAVPLVA